MFISDGIFSLLSLLCLFRVNIVFIIACIVSDGLRDRRAEGRNHLLGPGPNSSAGPLFENH